MPPLVDHEREKKINEALAAFRKGNTSIRNLALTYGLPRSTLRDRVKRANITKDSTSPQSKRALMLKSRAKDISEKQFKDYKLREREIVIQKALDYYHTEEGGKEGLRSLAAKFRIPRSTLRGRISGPIGSRYRVQKGQKLSLAEEEIIVSCVLDLCASGEEVTSSRVRNLANVLLQYRTPFPGTEIEVSSSNASQGIPKTIDPETGKINQVCLGWVRGFLGRHPELIDAKGRVLNVQTVKYLNRQSIEDWFLKIKDNVSGSSVCPENIYNFDFTNIRISQLIIDGLLQIVSSDSMPFHFKTSPQPEPFGIIECCSAAGKSLNPMVVFRKDSKYFESTTLKFQPEVANWSFSHSLNGEMDEELLLHWFNNWFDPLTSRELENINKKRILIADCPIGQHSKRFQEACAQKNVEFIPIPGSMAHELQPLDVGIFRGIKRNFCIRVQSFFRLANDMERGSITAKELLSRFCFTRKLGMIDTTIRNAFKLSGIYPYDPSVVINRIWDTSSTSETPYDSIIVNNTLTSNSMTSSLVQPNCDSETDGSSDEEHEHSYVNHSQTQFNQPSINNLQGNKPTSPIGGVDLISEEYMAVRSEPTGSFSYPTASSSSGASCTDGTSPSSSIDGTGYRNIAISELIFSPSASLDPISSEILNNSATLPILKEIQPGDSYFSSHKDSSSFPISRPVVQNDPLPSLPDVLSTSPGTTNSSHSFVEIAPLQSHALQHLQASQTVPLPPLSSSIMCRPQQPQQPQLKQHLPSLLTSTSFPSEQLQHQQRKLGALLNSSSLDFICNKDIPESSHKHPYEF